MWTLIKLFFPAAMKLIGYFVDKRATRIETKKAWLNLVQEFQKEGDQSAKIKRSYDAQVEKLKAKYESKKNPPQ